MESHLNLLMNNLGEQGLEKEEENQAVRQNLFQVTFNTVFLSEMIRTMLLSKYSKYFSILR